MCIQDMAIARRTIVRQHTHDKAAAAYTALPANPRRIRLIVNAHAGSVQVATGNPTAVGNILGVATTAGENTALVMRLEDYGAALTGELILGNGATANNGSVAEVLADDPLDAEIERAARALGR